MRISLKTWDKLVEAVRQEQANIATMDLPPTYVAPDDNLIEAADALCAYVLSHRAVIREALAVHLEYLEWEKNARKWASDTNYVWPVKEHRP